MTARLTAAAVAAMSLAGCTAAVLSNYRPGTEVRAAVGSPLIEVAWTPTALSRPQPRRQLVYAGRTGDTARFLLRVLDWERGGMLAQELHYDLGRSATIAVQEMRLEVLEASNEAVTARVLPAAALDARGEPLEPTPEVQPVRSLPMIRSRD